MCPDGAIGPGINQLRADTHLVALAQHAPLHNPVHSQLAGDVGQLLLGALVAHCRSQGDDAQRGNLAQVVDQLFRHSVGEILLPWIARKIFQRQNRDGVNPLPGIRIGGPFSIAGVGDHRDQGQSKHSASQQARRTAEFPRGRGGQHVFWRFRTLGGRFLLLCGCGDRRNNLVLRQSNCRQRLEDEPRHVRSAWKLNANRRFSVCFKVVLGQPLSNFRGFDADHRIASRVVIDRASEHLGSNHPLAQAIEIPCQGMLNDQMKEVLGALASREGVARG